MPDSSPRTRPRSRPSIMRMRWRHLLFAHWPIDAAKLRSLVPSELEIDEFDGKAWVGLVPFTMEDVSPRFVPRIPVQGLTQFHECNVRTYVYPRGMRDDPAAHGVWFFSLDAASRFAVWGARRYFGLRYFNARIDLGREGDVIDYSAQRLEPAAPSPPPSPDGRGRMSPALRCRWRALELLPPSKPGELAHFLTERYCLYAMHRGELRRGRITHLPWPLRRAKLLEFNDSLVHAAGIEVDQSPREAVVYHADRLDVRAWWLERV